MSNFSEIMEHCERVGSRLEKERILKDLDEAGRTLAKLGLDSGTTFGITADEFNVFHPGKYSWKSELFWNDIIVLCEKLIKRDLTGNDARDEVFKSLSRAPSFVAYKWATRILNKNLRCGVHTSTINKVFPGLIDPFAVARAETYDPEQHSLEGKWIAESKLDGLRMIVRENLALSRNGRTISTVSHIQEILKNVDPHGDFVFDGEVMGAKEFDESSGDIRRQSTGTNESLYYNVFDVIRKDEWDAKKTRSLSNRKDDLLSLLTEVVGPVRIVPWMPVPKNPSGVQLFAVMKAFIKQGFEGAMLKDMDASYIFKKSDVLLKLKDFKDMDCLVVDEYEGRGKYKGQLGGITVEHDGPKGKTTTNVGSGFLDEEREFCGKMIGRIAEIQYQNFTAKGRLRFPIFCKFRPDKE